MKIAGYTFTPEWRRLTLGGLIIGFIYLLIATVSGLSENVVHNISPFIGSLCGVLIGCVCLFINTLLLELTAHSVLRKGVRIFRLSYLGRYFLWAVALLVGYAYFDPFAVFIVLASPKITYLFLAITGKDTSFTEYKGKHLH